MTVAQLIKYLGRCNQTATVVMSTTRGYNDIVLVLEDNLPSAYEGGKPEACVFLTIE